MKIKRICPICLIEFTANYYNAIYCSTTCIKINKRQHRPLAIKSKKICPICKKEFIAKYYRQIHCSRTCRNNISTKTRLQRTCSICGRLFTPNSSNHRKCSENCTEIVDKRNYKKVYGHIPLSETHPNYSFISVDRSKQSFCTHCGSLRDLDTFSESSNSPNGRIGKCKFCESLYMSARGHNISFEEAVMIHNNTGWKCVACGKDFLKTFLNPKLLSRSYKFKYSFTLDHKVSKLRGGRSTIDNLQSMCWSCNVNKKNRSMKVFLNQQKTLVSI